MPIPVSPGLIDQVMTALGLANVGGERRARAETAIRFYVQVMGRDGPREIADHVQGIDLGAPVTRVDLLPDTEIVAYRYDRSGGTRPLDPFGTYFTVVGVSKYDLGIPTDDRRFVRYVVTSRVPALESRAKTGLVPVFGAVYGGAVQYVIPNASAHLRVAHIQHRIR